MHGTHIASAMTRRPAVLVVDDDPGILHVLSIGLSRALEGFEVMTAGNGREAIDLMAQRPPSVLVTDLAMPVMDGFALIAHVTNHRPTLPVVVLTGLASASTEPQLASFGSLRVLRKPVSYQTVARAVRDEIERLERGEKDGIALAGVLQLVESERRNCTVVVRSGKRRGHLHFDSGRLVNAFSDDFGAEGEAAAFDILGWPHTSIDLEPLPHHVRHLVDVPLQRLLAEVAAANTPAVAPAAQAGTEAPEVDMVPDRVHDAPNLASLDVGDRPDASAIPTDQGEADTMDALFGQANDIGSPGGEAHAMNAPAGEGDDDADADADSDTDIYIDTIVNTPVETEPAATAAAESGDHPEPDVTFAALDTPPDAVVATPAAAPAAAMSAGFHEPPPIQVAGAKDEDHVSRLIAAIERLAHRAREADEALAAVATEVEAFREARRRFDEVTEHRERRRQELEALRVDVAHLAREILGRVDRLFDPMQSEPTPPDAAQEPPSM